MLGDKDYIRIIEPLNKAAYGTPEKRMETWRKQFGTKGQSDNSRIIRVTKDNAEYLLSRHRKTDVPVYTEASLSDIFFYLDIDREVYQYVIGWVPKIIYDDGIWMYSKILADKKGITDKTVANNCVLGRLDYKEIRINGDFPSRKFIKLNEKVTYWITDILEPGLFQKRLSLLSQCLKHYRGNKSLFKRLEKLEKSLDLILHGPYHALSTEEYFKQNIKFLPDSKREWEKIIDEEIRQKSERNN